MADTIQVAANNGNSEQIHQQDDELAGNESFAYTLYAKSLAADRKPIDLGEAKFADLDENVKEDMNLLTVCRQIDKDSSAYLSQIDFLRCSPN